MSRARPWHSPMRRYVRLCYSGHRGAAHLGTDAYEAEWSRICTETDETIAVLTEHQHRCAHAFHEWLRGQAAAAEEQQHRAEFWESEWLS